MKISFKYIKTRLEELSRVRSKEYTIDNSFNGYHLMCGTDFLVTDESLSTINIVISALIKDSKHD